MSCYESLAGCYDAFLSDANYRRRAMLLAQEFRRNPRPVRTVLDLGCGSGTIACLLAERGYRVVAVDASQEMLTQAARKVERLRVRKSGVIPPLLIRQKMESLELAEPVDAVISTIDALNCLLTSGALRSTFRRVHRWLQPGGCFLFDVNTPAKFRRMDGRAYWEETEGCCCAWRTFYDWRTAICTYQVDLFLRRTDGAWERRYEEHRERGWSSAELRRHLTSAGFREIGIRWDAARASGTPETDRGCIRCRR